MKTNIATDNLQSQRLLRCGVSADTADMTRYEDDSVPMMPWDWTTGSYGGTFPAWTLSALLGLLPKEIKVDESPYDEVRKYGLLIYPFMGGWQVKYQDCEDAEGDYLKRVHGAYPIEACVKAIEWLTSNGYKINEI